VHKLLNTAVNLALTNDLINQILFILTLLDFRKFSRCLIQAKNGCSR
jgi:hypothetical protein